METLKRTIHLKGVEKEVIVCIYSLREGMKSRMTRTYQKYVDAYVNFYYYFVYVELKTSIRPAPPQPYHHVSFEAIFSISSCFDSWTFNQRYKTTI